MCYELHAFADRVEDAPEPWRLNPHRRIHLSSCPRIYAGSSQHQNCSRQNWFRGHCPFVPGGSPNTETGQRAANPQATLHSSCWPKPHRQELDRKLYPWHLSNSVLKSSHMTCKKTTCLHEIAHACTSLPIITLLACSYLNINPLRATWPAVGHSLDIKSMCASMDSVWLLRDRCPVHAMPCHATMALALSKKTVTK